MPGEQLRLRLDYRPDLFDRASIEALGERLLRLLEAAVAEPERPSGGSTFSALPSGRPSCGNGTTRCSRLRLRRWRSCLRRRRCEPPKQLRWCSRNSS